MREEPRCLQSQTGACTPGQGQGCWLPSILRPQLPVVLQHHQQRHPALLQRLLQLDAAPSDPEEPQGSAGLLPAAAAGAGADPGRRGTGGGPLARRLQRHLLRPWLPAAGPGSSSTASPTCLCVDSGCLATQTTKQSEQIQQKMWSSASNPDNPALYRKHMPPLQR
ncbi:transmembrane protein 134 isoform X8 [Pipistrellus kuhlii]|uniref:transmembrane protein 134 isoform X8 n=1 Tax=Pipistrellus kuhlii TaxID=59472 RepID=UPI001E2719B8|nr:transmembrane protein 134 isoform X8 [Pipistrellus kuhlii]XP_045429784.1 transmembrane protein 134 isoform X8 [Pipistrellus kuhlii]